MGHTTTQGDVRTRFNARAIFIDVGLSEAYGGHLGALIIEGGKLYTINGDEKSKLLSESDQAALPAKVAFARWFFNSCRPAFSPTDLI